MSNRPPIGQSAYNPIEKPIRYPLELCENLNICLWDESGKFKWAIGPSRIWSTPWRGWRSR